MTSLMFVYSTVYSGADPRKHQSSASLAFVRGTHWWSVNSLHKGSVMHKMIPFDDVIMNFHWLQSFHFRYGNGPYGEGVLCGMTLVTVPHWICTNDFPIYKSTVRVIMGRQGYSQNTGILVALVLNVWFCNMCWWLISWAFPVKLPSGWCHMTSLISSQHWFRWWFGASR